MHEVSPLRPTVFAAALLSLTLVWPGPAARAQGVQLPDMGDSAGRLISPTGEREYGVAMYRQFLQHGLVLDDPLVKSYVEHLCYQLVARSDSPDLNFEFFVVDSDVVNAFAAPGGYIGLHSELILTAQAESELAAVVAHEIAHVTQRHLVRAFEDASKMSIPMALAMIGAILASGGDGDAVQAAVVGGQALMAQRQINFTRSNEHEADRIGIQTLARAGLRPEAMGTFFERMGKISRLYGEGPPEFLRTHPVTTTRIAEAKSRAAQLDAGADPDNETFLRMRARIRALAGDDIRGTVQAFEDDLRGKEISQQPADFYGYAVALRRNGRAERALAIADTLAAAAPDVLAYRLLLADARSDLGQQDLARTDYEALLATHPGNLAVLMSYGEALIATDHTEDAKQGERLLRPQLLENPDEPRLLALYARLADGAGDRVRAAEATADRYRALGANYEAMKQLERLARDPELDYYQRSRVTARLAEIRPLLTDDEIRREEEREQRRRLSITDL